MPLEFFFARDRASLVARFDIDDSLPRAMSVPFAKELAKGIKLVRDRVACISLGVKTFPKPE